MHGRAVEQHPDPDDPVLAEIGEKAGVTAAEEVVVALTGGPEGETLLRRGANPPQETTLGLADLRLDLIRRRVERAGQRLDLTA